MPYRPYIITFCFALVVALTAHFGWWQSLASLIQTPIQPVMASETSAGRKTIGFLSVISSLRGLAVENATLQAKIGELEAEIAQLKEVRHENDILRQELGFIKEQPDQYIPAQLIGRTAAGLIKDLIIARGSRDGIVTGQAVVAQGHLIGMVSEVSDRQATVRLVTHPRSLIPVILQESRTTGLLRGGISGLSMTDILIDATIKSGEPIVTSGLGGLLPQGIPVGRVVAVTAQRGDITKRASVSAPVDVTKLEMVFIRKGE